jgi:hypothetical protein
MDIKDAIAKNLIFKHPARQGDPPDSIYERWPFVYFHGEAECRTHDYPYAFLECGEPTDICVANLPMSEFFSEDFRGVKFIPCTVALQPAWVFVQVRSGGDIRGRVVLASDTQSMAHAMTPNDWR